MSYGELMMLVQILDGEKIRIEGEYQKMVEVEKLEFISALEMKRIDAGKLHFYLLC